MNTPSLLRDQPSIKLLNHTTTHHMKDPKMVQKCMPFEAKLNIMHEIGDHQRTWIKAELRVVGVLQERCQRT